MPRCGAPAHTTMDLYIDTETFSPINLKTAGLARYATQVEVMLVSWAVGDGPAYCWDVTTGDAMPPKLLAAARDCTRVLAHNAQFDTAVLEHALPDLAALLRGKWYCTLAQAQRHGLPGALYKLSLALRLPQDKQKDARGRDLIRMFCIQPKSGERSTRASHPQEWREFVQYATQDIVALRAAHRKLPTWNDTEAELAIWDWDRRVNLRGIAVDTQFARSAVRAADEAQGRLDKATKAIAGSALKRTTQRDKLLALLFAEYGVQLADLSADTVERRLADPELPEHAKDLLRIRLQASKSSVGKYNRILDMEVGGRMYYLLSYCAAYRTGRWAGAGFQPQNLPRPALKHAEVLVAIQAILEGAEAFVATLPHPTLATAGPDLKAADQDVLLYPALLACDSKWRRGSQGNVGSCVGWGASLAG